MGVGDFGEEGDFCGEEAIVHTTEKNRVNPQKTAEQKRVKTAKESNRGKKNQCPLPTAETEFQTFLPKFVMRLRP